MTSFAKILKTGTKGMHWGKRKDSPEHVEAVADLQKQGYVTLPHDSDQSTLLHHPDTNEVREVRTNNLGTKTHKLSPRELGETQGYGSFGAELRGVKTSNPFSKDTDHYKNYNEGYNVGRMERTHEMRS